MSVSDPTAHPARALALTACALTLPTPIGAQIRVGTQTVPLYVTVTDAPSGSSPISLREDFEVYDNGKLQTLTNFDNQATPITVVVMLDTSGSMTLALDMVKQAAEEFLMRLLPEDKAKVGAFNDKIQVKPETGLPFTNNRDQLIRSLQRSRLRLPDAAVRRRRLQHHAARRSSKAARSCSSSPTATTPRAKLGSGDVNERARAQEVMVYSVGLENDYFNGTQRVRTLDRIAG